MYLFHKSYEYFEKKVFVFFCISLLYKTKFEELTIFF